jgi:S-adenosylmethionine:tRNA ribosyltransferase-isomerase
MRLSDFDFHLPDELIAQKPVEPRDRSRLLVLFRDTGAIQHRGFRDLGDYLGPGDVLVLNDTRVIPARLIGTKAATGGQVELLLLKRLSLDRWETLVRPGRRVHEGTEIVFGNGELVAVGEESTDAGGRVVRFRFDGAFEEVLDWLGKMPLPPYITLPLDDPERYQTVYSRVRGSAAAPTAGLHFTKDFLRDLQNRGISVAYITLHVGLGTFRPVQTEDIREHQMHSEYYAISQEAARTVAKAQQEGRRVVAVGTTCVRTLESVADADGFIQAGSGWTDIFIYPGYRFKVLDAMVTNFHLPKSSLVMLVSAFAGREKVLAAYREAVEERYRFFSFGDAMLVL